MSMLMLVILPCKVVIFVLDAITFALNEFISVDWVVAFAFDSVNAESIAANDML